MDPNIILLKSEKHSLKFGRCCYQVPHGDHFQRFVIRFCYESSAIQVGVEPFTSKDKGKKFPFDVCIPLLCVTKAFGCECNRVPLLQQCTTPKLSELASAWIVTGRFLIKVLQAVFNCLHQEWLQLLKCCMFAEGVQLYIAFFCSIALSGALWWLRCGMKGCMKLTIPGKLCSCVLSSYGGKSDMPCILAGSGLIPSAEKVLPKNINLRLHDEAFGWVEDLSLLFFSLHQIW